MTRIIRFAVLIVMLTLGAGIPTGSSEAQPYFRRWMAPYPTYTCTDTGPSITVALSSQPVEWDLPANNEHTITYIDNGVPTVSGPFVQGIPLVSSQVYGAFAEIIPGSYPVVFEFRLDTFVGGVHVYRSTLTVQCAADGSGPVTVVNTEITAALPPAPPPALPGPDMVNIPSTAVVGAVLTTTPIYFAPQDDAATPLLLVAGKTAWVFGVDASGEFYKLVMGGKFFWVPVETMGPNYDNVWQGRPLPTEVVS